MVFFPQMLLQRFVFLQFFPAEFTRGWCGLQVRSAHVISHVRFVVLFSRDGGTSLPWTYGKAGFRVRQGDRHQRIRRWVRKGHGV